MMAVNHKQLSEATQEPTSRQSEVLDKARGLSRRTQALLAAAGQSEASVARWYVLVIADGKDNAVDNALANAGITHWMATIKHTGKWRGGRRFQRFCVVAKPAFPGYMFVQMHWSDASIEALKSIEGVVGIIGGAISPARLKASEFNKFRARADEDPTFLLQLINALQKGDAVRVDDGPFASFEGIVKALGKAGRIKVEVDVFGRVAPIDVHLAQVTKLE